MSSAFSECCRIFIIAIIKKTTQVLVFQMVVHIASFIEREIRIPLQGEWDLPLAIADQIQFIEKLTPLHSQLHTAMCFCHFDKSTSVYNITFRIGLDERSFLNIFFVGNQVKQNGVPFCHITSENIQFVIFPRLCSQLQTSRRKISQYKMYYNGLPNVHDISACDEFLPLQNAVSVVSLQHMLELAKQTFQEPERILSDVSPPLNRFLFYGGPPMLMQHMDRTQKVYDGENTSILNLFMKKMIEATSKKQQIKTYMHGIPICDFIENPTAIGLIAAPETDSSTVYACLCVERIPLATKDNRMNSVIIPEHIQLRWFSVDAICDEEMRDTAIEDENRDSLPMGIKYQFFTAAYNYLLQHWGDLPMIYIGKDATLATFLKDVGFKDSESTQKTPVLLKSILPATCDTWDDCQKLVRDRFPEKSLLERLKLASLYYTNKKGVDRKQQMHMRSNAPVSLATGAQILKDYYYDKFITPVFEIRVNSKGDEPSTKPPLWKDMTEEHRSAWTYAITHIRRNLLQIQKRVDRTVNADSVKSWRFRPNPNKTLSPTISAEGPELYYLKELTADEPTVGKELFSHPFSIDTPDELVWHASPKKWKSPKLASLEF
jgi:hypothetical protein